MCPRSHCVQRETERVSKSEFERKCQTLAAKHFGELKTLGMKNGMEIIIITTGSHCWGFTESWVRSPCCRVLSLRPVWPQLNSGSRMGPGRVLGKWMFANVMITTLQFKFREVCETPNENSLCWPIWGFSAGLISEPSRVGGGVFANVMAVRKGDT